MESLNKYSISVNVYLITLIKYSIEPFNEYTKAFNMFNLNIFTGLLNKYTEPFNKYPKAFNISLFLITLNIPVCTEPLNK